MKRTLLALLIAAPALTGNAFGAQSESSFPIRRILVEGNTLLATSALESTLQALIGENRTVADLLAARTLIESSYREAGYRLVNVGIARSIDGDGTLRFQVVELPVSDVRVTGSTDTERIRAALPSLRTAESPNLLKLSRELYLANDNPNRTLSVEFSQQDKGIVAEIGVSEQPPLKIALTLDNSGTHDSGRSRAGVVLHHANFFGLDHQLTAAYTTSVEQSENVSIAAFSYQIPLAAVGDSLMLSASYSDVNSGRVDDVFAVSGQGYGYGIHYQRNLTRDATSRTLLDVGIDSRHYRNVVDFFGVNLGADVDSRPLTVSYRASGRGERDNFAVSASVLRNLPGGGLNNDEAYALARAGATADWTSWHASAQWTHRFAGDWRLGLRAEGQYARAALISGEQFGIGGARSVRGLEEREAAGERGWSGTAEIQTPLMREAHRLSAFADIGHISRLNTQGESPEQGAASWGIGWKFVGWNAFSVNLDLANVRDGAGKTEKGRTRGHLAAVWSLL